MKAATATAVRRALDTIYLWTAYAGAVSIVGIGLLISAQVVGRELGVQVKGADDLTAWSVVAAGFLPLAHTYRQNGQVRVILLIQQFLGRKRTMVELVVLAMALFFVGFLSFSALDMAWDSYRFGDLSQGLIVIPIWIPQISIGVGSCVLTVAILDDIVVAAWGGDPSYVTAAEETSREHKKIGVTLAGTAEPVSSETN
ncbi:MAG: TRAP transporter small permease [Paracoccaceae bacterium]|nr:TRAP transporter small permease [Paracoccaceae bacterium]